MTVEGKNILVVGIARSGVAVARLLMARGANVTANDMKEESQLAREAEELRAMGAQLALGGHPDELFAKADLIVLSPGVPADLPQIAYWVRASIDSGTNAASVAKSLFLRHRARR